MQNGCGRKGRLLKTDLLPPPPLHPGDKWENVCTRQANLRATSSPSEWRKRKTQSIYFISLSCQEMKSTSPSLSAILISRGRNGNEHYKAHQTRTHLHYIYFPDTGQWNGGRFTAGLCNSMASTCSFSLASAWGLPLHGSPLAYIRDWGCESNHYYFIIDMSRYFNATLHQGLWKSDIHFSLKWIWTVQFCFWWHWKRNPWMNIYFQYFYRYRVFKCYDVVVKVK